MTKIITNRQVFAKMPFILTANKTQTITLMLLPNNSQTSRFNSIKYLLLIYLTILLGVMSQGGDYFWFGLAAASCYFLLFYGTAINLKKEILLPKSYLLTTLFLFLLWCSLTAFWSIVPALSFMRIFTLSAVLIGVYLYFLLTCEVITWKQLWIVVMGAGITLCGLSIFEAFNGATRPSSLFINPNTFAAYLNLITLPTLSYFFLSKEKFALRLLIPISIFTFSMALTAGSAAFYSQIIGVLFLIFIAKSSITKTKLVTFFFIYIIALISAQIVTGEFTRVSPDEVLSNSGSRWVIWEASLNLLVDSPWYGNGIGTYWLQYPQYRLPTDAAGGQNAHNDYLQYLIEGGIPALALLTAFIIMLCHSWYKFIRNQKTPVKKSIEATGLFVAILAIGIHSFFSFNLSVFSILFLIGLLLGRFIHVTRQIKTSHFFSCINAPKKLLLTFNTSLLMVFLSYFAIVSSFSYLYIRAANYYIAGEITKADESNSIALSIYPYDDRPYLLYVHIYRDILDKVTELPSSKKAHYYAESLKYIGIAREINPYRADNYYLHAQIIEKNSELASAAEQKEIIDLYNRGLKIDPMHINSARALADYYLIQNKKLLAIKTIQKSIQWFHPKTKITLDFYNYAESILENDNNNEYLIILSEKKSRLAESLQRAAELHQ